MIESLIALLIWLAILGVIYWLGQMLINALPMGEPVKSVARVILLVIVILIVIYMLVGFLPPLHGGLSFPRRP
jgi:hypothetical protein